jgi:hypothetical protein
MLARRLLPTWRAAATRGASPLLGGRATVATRLQEPRIPTILGARLVSTAESCEDTLKAYSIRVDGIPAEKARTLSTADVLETFGQFEPFNIVITRKEKNWQPEEDEGKAKGQPRPPQLNPHVYVTFQVRLDNNHAGSWCTPKHTHLPSSERVSCGRILVDLNHKHG